MKPSGNRTLYRRLRRSPALLAATATLLAHALIVVILILLPLSRQEGRYLNYIAISDLSLLEEFERTQPPAASFKPDKPVEPGPVISQNPSVTADLSDKATDTTLIAEEADGGNMPDRGLPVDTLNYMSLFSADGIKANVKLPTFQGGDYNNFHNWFVRRFRTPFDAPDNYHERVIVSFSVDKNGRMGNIKVRACSSEVVKNEIIRVLNNAPAWEPGVYNGDYASFNLQMPVRF